MSWDIYGQPLRSGHCEVHPDVHEEYPCSLCFMEKDRQEEKNQEEDEYNVYIEREYMKYLTAEWVAYHFTTA